MVRAIMIIEIMGRPGPHIKEALEKHVQNLDNSKAVETHSIKISDPKEIEREAPGPGVPSEKGKDQKDVDPMFTCFAEVDFEVEELMVLTQIVFDFMPSSVEVIEPHNFSIDANEITELLNNIGGRLHRYDEVAKMAHGRIGYLEAMLKRAQGEGGGKKDDGKESKKKAKKASKKK